VTKKQRQAIAESFTLQFGEPDEGHAASEIDISDDVFVDDNFMWKNATAFLDDALPGKAAAPLEPAAPEPRDAPKVVTASGAAVGAAAFPKVTPVEDDLGQEDNVEPLVVDERQAGAMLRGPQDGVDVSQEDVPDDEQEPMVLDERQMAMVTAPDTAPDGDEAAFDEPDPSALRADPAEAILRRDLRRPRGADAPERVAVSGDDPAGALFVDDDDLSPVPLAAERGTKTPWIIYGTFGLGLAVVGVAAVGMLLQLGKTPAPVGSVTAEAAAPEAGEPAVLASVATTGGAASDGQAAIDQAAAGQGASQIDPQMNVLRLAVGPFVDSESNLSLPQARLANETYGAPVQVAMSEVGTPYVPDLRASLPASVTTEVLQGFDTVTEDIELVTVAADRIELDLSDQQGTGAPVEQVTLASIASVTVDPQVGGDAAPQLASVQSDAPEQNPQEARVSRSLFETITQMSEDAATMDATVLALRPLPGDLGGDAVSLAGFDAPIERAALVPLAQFDLVGETLAGLLKPEAPQSPVVAVRLALAELALAADPQEVATLRVAALAQETQLVQPAAFADVSTPEPNLPTPSIDTSRQLMAAVKLLEEETARVLAGKTARPEELSKAAQLVNGIETPLPVGTDEAAGASLQTVAQGAEAASPAVDTAIEPVKTDVTPTVVAEAEGAAVDVEPRAPLATLDQPQTAVRPQVEIADRPVQEPVQLAQTQGEAEPAPAPEQKAELNALAAIIETPAKWVSEATWTPELGFAVSPIERDGRKVLQVTQATDASVLPDWAATGAEILSVNGNSVESEDALISALLSRDLDADAGLASAVLEIRARAGLDPRMGRVTVPLWRGVTLGDGTKLSVRLDQGKWNTEVLSRETADVEGLRTGDILLRDFATKSKLAGPLDLEEVFEATTEAGETRVEFAVMRDGELASGGVSLK